jgi:hypothetical protein
VAEGDTEKKRDEVFGNSILGRRGRGVDTSNHEVLGALTGGYFDVC